MRSVLSFGWLALMVVVALGCGPKPKYPSCGGDTDCRKGEKCINKQCVQCSQNADCGDGQQCVNGACEAVPGWCSADGDCPSGEVCKNNHCEACVADSECGEGGKCREGKCLRKGQCSTDNDCAEDEDCVQGVCTKAGQPAADTGPKCNLSPVYFGFDQSSIGDDAKPILQSNSTCLSSTPKGVVVTGMTDPRGTDEYNIALSDQRARAVMDYLSRLGINGSRMRVNPKGESGATGTDETSWAKDRRVEFAWE